MNFTPKEYQKRIIKFMAEIPRCNIWAGMGLGKTISSLTAIGIIKDIYGLQEPVLVIAPKRVSLEVWPEEIKKWPHLKNLKISCISSGKTAKKRIELLCKDADIYSINYENLVWLETTLKKIKRKFNFIIADESTKLKGFRLKGGGRRALALAHICLESERFVNLTGTPTPKGVIDLWGQNYFIDQGERLGRTFSAFKDRWFKYDGIGKYAKIIPLDHAHKEIVNAISDVTLSIRTEDYFDLKKPIINNVKACLPTKAKEVYKSMENHLFADLEAGLIEAPTAATKTIKCLQICSGGLYHSEEEKKGYYEKIHESKLEVLESIINEWGGEPILVGYQWRFDFDFIKAKFPQARSIKELGVIEEWNKGNVPLLLAHPKSAGHGLNLQYGGRIVVMYSHWWENELYYQFIERIGPVRQKQAGFERNVYIYNIIAHETLEEDVVANRETQQDIQDVLLKRMSKERI